MTTETVQTTQPAFATRATLDAHIAAMGHELVPSEDEGIYLCVTCGAHTEEDVEGVSVRQIPTAKDRGLVRKQRPALPQTYGYLNG